jgi:hypothetical protein
MDPDDCFLEDILLANDKEQFGLITLCGVKILYIARTRRLRLPDVIVDDASQEILSTNRSFCSPYWPGETSRLQYMPSQNECSQQQ